jgi:hypothetical protein
MDELNSTSVVSSLFFFSIKSAMCIVMYIKVEVYDRKPYSNHFYGFISYVSAFFIKGIGYQLTLKDIF